VTARKALANDRFGDLCRDAEICMLRLRTNAASAKNEKRMTALSAKRAFEQITANVWFPPFSRCRGGETKDFAFAANGSKVRSADLPAPRSEGRKSLAQLMDKNAERRGQVNTIGNTVSRHAARAKLGKC